jgi:hypothetical protein
MQFRLRTLLIVLAIGLALLQFVVFLIPYNDETTKLAAWFLWLDLVSYVVPLVQTCALVIALTIRNDSSKNDQLKTPTLRFAIRDLLWLMVVVGMGVALWQDRIKTTIIRSDSTWNFNALKLLIESKGFVVRNDERGLGVRERNGPWSAAINRDQD